MGNLFAEEGLRESEDSEGVDDAAQTADGTDEAASDEVDKGEEAKRAEKAAEQTSDQASVKVSQATKSVVRGTFFKTVGCISAPSRLPPATYAR